MTLVSIQAFEYRTSAGLRGVCFVGDRGVLGRSFFSDSGLRSCMVPLTVLPDVQSRTYHGVNAYIAGSRPVPVMWLSGKNTDLKLPLALRCGLSPPSWAADGFNAC